MPTGFMHVRYGSGKSSPVLKVENLILPVLEQLPAGRIKHQGGHQTCGPMQERMTVLTYHIHTPVGASQEPPRVVRPLH